MAQKWEQVPTEDLTREINGDPDLFEQKLLKDPDAFAISPSKYLHSLIAQRDISLPELIQKSGLSKAFVYQIFAGKRAPGRDSLLRISLSIGLPLDETQRLLALWDRSPLYPRLRRDAALMLCTKRGLPLQESLDYLLSIGEKPLQ